MSTKKKIKRDRWHFKEMLFPEKLKAKIESIYDTESIEYFRAVKLLKRILNNYKRSKTPIDEGLPMPQEYFKKILTSKYMKIKTTLSDEGILIQTRNHSTTNHVCKAYKINNDFIQCEQVALLYKETVRRFNAEEKLIMSGFDGVDMNLPCSPFELVNGRDYGKPNPTTYKVVDALEDILNKDWRASRNKTNYRADTNFTNLNAKYRKFITIDGEKTKNIDLVNSQFALLSNIILSIRGNIDTLYLEYNILPITRFIKWLQMYTLSKQIEFTDDLLEFCEICTSGKLYETIERKLNLESRDKSKNLMMKLMFGNTMKRTIVFPDSKPKSTLRSQYPTIVSIVDSYKAYCIESYRVKFYNNPKSYKRMYRNETPEEFGAKQLSILLQLLESRIFIDELLKPLIHEGHHLISIHDSLLVKSSFDESLVMNTLDKCLPFGYECRIEV